MAYKDLIRTHRYAIVCSLLIGCIYLLPNIIFYFEAGDNYHYPFLAMPDERHYASRIKEVYDGHYAIKNPDLKEYKDSPSFWQPFPELIVAGMGKMLGLDVEELLVFTDFIFA